MGVRLPRNYQDLWMGCSGGSLGDALPQPDGREGGLDRVGGAQVYPVLGAVPVELEPRRWQVMLADNSTSRLSVIFLTALGNLAPWLASNAALRRRR
jgi:hypothetical protein